MSSSGKRLMGISALASLLMGLAMLVGKLLFQAAIAPEMLFNFTGQLLGVPWIFNLVHSLPFGLDSYAKFVLFGVTSLIFLLLWFVIGLNHNRIVKRLGTVGSSGFYIALSVFLVAFVLFPLQGLGVFGLSDANFAYPPLASHLWAMLFGAVFALPLHVLSSRQPSFDSARRESLHTIISASAVIASLTVFGQTLITGLAKAQDAMTAYISQIMGISPEITATEDHYQISKNTFNPAVKEADWSLKVRGLVDNELTLTLDDLKALPSVERASTLMCISNRVGGNLIGNSVWTGVRLKDVLEAAGIQSDASELILRAADNYSDSFKLDAAMREGTIIAYLQNGEPLTKDHGFPARVLVPGIYGMKNVKWVTELELANEDYTGYWQSRGWSDEAIVKTLSRIDTKEATVAADGTASIGGIAFAGLRTISEVEVSVDGGESWQKADVKPAINELSWNLWGFRWEAAPGDYTVLVRATDGSGVTQTSEKVRALPDGASGYHELKVKVA